MRGEGHATDLRDILRNRIHHLDGKLTSRVCRERGTVDLGDIRRSRRREVQNLHGQTTGSRDRCDCYASDLRDILRDRVRHLDREVPRSHDSDCYAIDLRQVLSSGDRIENLHGQAARSRDRCDCYAGNLRQILRDRIHDLDGKLTGCMRSEGGTVDCGDIRRAASREVQHVHRQHAGSVDHYRCASDCGDIRRTTSRKVVYVNEQNTGGRDHYRHARDLDDVRVRRARRSPCRGQRVERRHGRTVNVQVTPSVPERRQGQPLRCAVLLRDKARRTVARRTPMRDDIGRVSVALQCHDLAPVLVHIADRDCRSAAILVEIVHVRVAVAGACHGSVLRCSSRPHCGAKMRESVEQPRETNVDQRPDADRCEFRSARHALSDHRGVRLTSVEDRIAVADREVRALCVCELAAEQARRRLWSLLPTCWRLLLRSGH